MIAKATRASCAVAFLVTAAFAATTAPMAIAGPVPRIVVEPVTAQLDDGRPAIRVSIANDSSTPIAIDPSAVDVFRARLISGRRTNRLAFSPMIRYPCSSGASDVRMVPTTVESSGATTIVFSTPEPPSSAPPAPVASPLVLEPGANALTAPFVFGIIECQGGFVDPQAWAVYATVTWHDLDSEKRSRIVSAVRRVMTFPRQSSVAPIEDGGPRDSNVPSRASARFGIFRASPEER